MVKSPLLAVAVAVAFPTAETLVDKEPFDVNTLVDKELCVPDVIGAKGVFVPDALVDKELILVRLRRDNAIILSLPPPVIRKASPS
jgi:hypothetical protein